MSDDGALEPVEELTPLEASVEWAALADKIAVHDKAYYQKDAPEITDAQYDALRRRLQALETAFPALVRPDSPTQRVGAAPATGFSKVPHAVPMLSLGNAFDDADVHEFVKGVRRFLKLAPDEAVEIVCEPKIDGLSVSLRYENGKFVQGATRGDGTTGEDITENLKTLSELPMTLDSAPDVLEVRGEVYMTRSDFGKLNQAQEKAGAKVFANPRNAAAGSLRQKDASVTASRSLRLFAYAWGEVSETVAETHWDFLTKLRGWGFPTNPLARLARTTDQGLAFYNEIEAGRAALDYEIDGMVYKVNRLDWQQRLGAVSRAPRWAIAHKFAAEKAETVIKAINEQVGRTGILTPVAEFEPVTVGGVVVSRASLHNEDQVRKLDVRVGDSVIIQRAGDVIPQVLEVAKDTAHEGRQEYKFHKQCPECGSQVVREEGEVARRCTGGLVCPAQKLERLKHFVSRNAFDIEGLGEAYIQLFINEGLVSEPADIFVLNKRSQEVTRVVAEWHKKKAFARKKPNGRQKKTNKKRKENDDYESVRKLFTAIENKARMPMQRVIYALGIRHVGEVTAKNLAKKYANFPTFLKSVKEASKKRPGAALVELSSIKGIGPISLEKLLEFFEKNKELKNLEISSGLEEQILKLKIKRINKSASHELAMHYMHWTVFQNAMYQAIEQQPGEKYKEMSELEGVGVVASEAIIDFFAEERNAKMVQRLLDHINVFNDATDSKSGPFSGMTIVFTGGLEEFSRNEAKVVAERLGGRIASSISKNTNLVVAGTGAGSKLKEAQKLGVKVINEAEWLKLVQGK